MTEQTAKRAYTAPQLQEFGSVRNLTGGSNLSQMDLDNTNSLSPDGMSGM